MAGHIVESSKQNIYKALYKNMTWTAGANLWVALSTTTPAEDGTNFTEPVGGDYARVARVVADWTDPTADGSGDNATRVEFPRATAGWGIITYAGLFDLAAAGNLIAFYSLNTAYDVIAGVKFVFDIGDLDFGPWALP